MRVGTLCLATDQGLGVLARDFYRNEVVTHPVIMPHSSRENHYDWYPAGTPVVGVGGTATTHLTDLNLDAVIFFETPFEWGLIPWLKSQGVKTVLMPMHECMPAEWSHQPDLVINPSLLEQQLYPHGVFIPVPVGQVWRKRDRAEVFVHNAGNGGLRGRNGTAELLEAWKLVKSPAKLLLRTQANRSVLGSDERIEWTIGTLPSKQLYKTGDVFVFPEKFNGLSLPLQEAYASGMGVMATERFPMTTWLPGPMLIQPSSFSKQRVSPRFQEFDEQAIDPKEIARMVDQWYGKAIGEFSECGREWAEQNSWDKLKPRYMEALS